jgi:hypothetical protein
VGFGGKVFFAPVSIDNLLSVVEAVYGLLEF